MRTLIVKNIQKKNKEMDGIIHKNFSEKTVMVSWKLSFSTEKNKYDNILTLVIELLLKTILFIDKFDIMLIIYQNMNFIYLIY